MKHIWFVLILFILVLSACQPAPAPTPIPTIVFDTSSSGTSTQPSTNQGSTVTTGVTASAVVMPVQDAQLAFALPGNVKKVNVAVGDQVKSGDILAELDNTSIQLDVASAERTVRELTSAAAIAAAEQAVANAQDVFEDAQKKSESLKYRRADNVTIDYLKDQVTLAQDALDRARDSYKQVSKLSRVDPTRANAATRLYNAQLAYNKALGSLNWYANPPDENDVALATANLDAATAALQEAKWYVSELKGETIPPDATGAQLAQLQQARASLTAAKDQLEHTLLRSPISGAVLNVNIAPGEYVTPGQPLIDVSDVNNLQVKTTDLSERDIPRVKIGAPASITVDALSDTFDGKVISISPVANTLGGDVVYEVTIGFTEKPKGLLGGMSAEVTIGEE